MPTGPFLPIDKPKRRRRPYAERYEANNAAGVPKVGMRLKDDAVLEWARNRGVCEVCERTVKTEPLHVRTRGCGAPDSFQNVVAGCRECHIRTQDAGEAGRQELRAAIARREAFE